MHAYMLAVFVVTAIVEVPKAMYHLLSICFCCGTHDGCLVTVVVDGAGQHSPDNMGQQLVKIPIGYIFIRMMTSLNPGDRGFL